jgi:hypothetical protein
VDQFGIDGMRQETIGKVLFAHPQSRFAIRVTREEQIVSFRFGVLDESLKATPTPGGVVFRLLFRAPGAMPTEVWSARLDITRNVSDRGPHSALVKISGAGELIFATSAAGSPYNLWAYWAAVLIR